MKEKEIKKQKNVNTKAKKKQLKKKRLRAGKKHFVFKLYIKLK